MMISNILKLVAASLMALFCTSMTAANANPMSFTLERTDARSVGLDLFQIIFADGEITAQTGKQFREWAAANQLIPGATVYFNSPGGSVVGGLQLGQAIRDLGFETDVGRPKSQPGYCLSACAYAYLGGVFRYMSDDAIYGVHRFYGQITGDDAQIMSGIISGYIEKMGAKPALFQLMTIKGQDEILPIPVDVLTELNVVNNGVASTVWDIQNVDEVGFYLRGTTVTNRGEHKMLFTCHDRSLYGLPMLSSPDPELVVRNTGKINWIVDGQWLLPLPSGAGLPEAEPDRVSTSIIIPPALYRLIANAKSVGFAWQNINGKIYSGFEISLENGSSKLKTFARTCNPTLYP